MALGQLIYDETGLIFAQAKINHSPEGETPVYVRTNAKGQAVFHVADPAPQQHPIDFQAWLQPTGGYPFGYSELVSVVWRESNGKVPGALRRNPLTERNPARGRLCELAAT